MSAVLLAVSATPLAVDDLTGGERAALPRQEPRRRSWLIARRALRAALTACGQPADTATYRFPGPVASLSHTADLAVAAVAVAAPAAVVGVGVDVEVDREPDPRTARFFLTAPELAWLATVADADRPRTLLRLWTVKEAVFKADPANAGTVLRDYVLATPAAPQGRATRAGTSFQYVSLALPRGFLTVAVALSRPPEVAPVPSVSYDEIAAHISALTSVPVARLAPDTPVVDLVADSFMFVEVAVDLQEEYDVVLTQQDLKGVLTLGDLAALIAARQGATPDA